MTTSLDLQPERSKAAASGAAGYGSISASRLAEDPFVEWLLTEGFMIADVKAFVRALSLRLAAGVAPITRLRVTMRILHPQFIGTTYMWCSGVEEIEEYRPPHAILQEDRYLNSPFAAIFQGAGAIRRRIEGPNAVLDFPILSELQEEGATDYVALPLKFSSGKLSALTIATARPGGFAAAELRRIDDALPVLAHIFELHTMRETARAILETYLGPHRGGQVLDGRIRRGDGELIHAIIWFCDLRGSTRLAGEMPRGDYITMLNDFFECTAGAIIEHGGEVLNFLGDGAIGIFPVPGGKPADERCPEEDAACARAISAVREAFARVDRLNAERLSAGTKAIAFGIGLHRGDVLYGNIGVPQRLDFTVIGPAANETARIEAMCKTLDKPVLISAELARVTREPLVSLGFHVLRGVREPHEIFTLPGF
jgi:adenylate cyclase